MARAIPSSPSSTSASTSSFGWSSGDRSGAQRRARHLHAHELERAGQLLLGHRHQRNEFIAVMRMLAMGDRGIAHGCDERCWWLVIGRDRVMARSALQVALVERRPRDNVASSGAGDRLFGLSAIRLHAGPSRPGRCGFIQNSGTARATATRSGCRNRAVPHT